jgi:ABC-2 type transport system permease protein
MITLVRKLLRDLRVPLLVVCLILCAFQCFWVKITQRVVTDVSPFFASITTALQKVPAALVSKEGDLSKIIENRLFKGPGRIMQTLAGGDNMRFEKAMDMLSIGYVHPLMQTLFCIWAIGRAAGAIAGELDKGTMELLMAQPISRRTVILSHLIVDLMTIPVLCLALWSGTFIGEKLIGPFHVDEADFADLPSFLRNEVKVDPEVLQIDPLAFWPGVINIGALIFAVCGYTMWISALGRFRWRVMGIAVLVTLLQFILNMAGQLWDVLAPFRPFSVFYYFQPQRMILRHGTHVDFSVWNSGHPLVEVAANWVLFGVGIVGYLLALWSFKRRDLPAPL